MYLACKCSVQNNHQRRSKVTTFPQQHQQRCLEVHSFFNPRMRLAAFFSLCEHISWHSVCTSQLRHMVYNALRISELTDIRLLKCKFPPMILRHPRNVQARRLGRTERAGRTRTSPAWDLAYMPLLSFGRMHLISQQQSQSRKKPTF